MWNALPIWLSVSLQSGFKSKVVINCDLSQWNVELFFLHLYKRKSDYYMWNHSIVCERDSNSMAFISSTAKKNYKTATIKHTFRSIRMFKQFTVVVSFFAQNWYRFVNSIMKWIIIWSLVFLLSNFSYNQQSKVYHFHKTYNNFVHACVCAFFSLFSPTFIQNMNTQN